MAGKKTFDPILEFSVGSMYAHGVGTRELAQMLDCSAEHIRRTVRRSGFKLRPKGGGWKGQRFVTRFGYVIVSLPPDHRFVSMLNSAGQVAEHRVVMADYLDRPLKEIETVHHINGDRQDNRIENLELRIGNHGSGAVYCCADCGSRNVVAQPLAS